MLKRSPFKLVILAHSLTEGLLFLISTLNLSPGLKRQKNSFLEFFVQTMNTVQWTVSNLNAINQLINLNLITKLNYQIQIVENGRTL